METDIRHEPNLQHDSDIHEGEKISAMRAVVTGSLGGYIFGIAAVVLSIIGLTNVFPQYLLPIAAIAVGASMLFEGSSIATRLGALMEVIGGDSRFRMDEIGIGMTSLFLGGIAGIVLGILALLGMVPQILVASSIIVFGVALVFSSGLIARLNDLEIECRSVSEAYRSITREAVSASASIQFVIGLGAAVLGILAVTGFTPQILSLVAVLAVGFSIFADGTALTARMSSAYRKC
ncbi:MAG: hypothetical protein PHY31_03710 [Smithellaceae bacterium]|nr:hypothetical protein [Smithellaceae bacterium]